MRKLTQADSSLYNLEELVDEIVCFVFPSTASGYMHPTLRFGKLYFAQSSQLIIPSGQWASLSALGCQGKVVIPVQLWIPCDHTCHPTICLCNSASEGVLTLGQAYRPCFYGVLT